jgi:branched-chain amino acid transport system substrate-binding protein
MSWHGEQHQGGVELAVAELNEAGGVLGEAVMVVIADDYCDGDQALATAKKLAAAGVAVGHNCSGAAIPVSAAYEDAGIIMISPTATNPKLTDRGFRHIFRMVARDTLHGEMAATYLAERWADGRIAILHDGQAYGQGLAEETQWQLEARRWRQRSSSRLHLASRTTRRSW